MKAEIYKPDGSKSGYVELPNIFNEEYRPDLIKRAFLAELSHKIQPWGSDQFSGLRRIAESWDVGGGRSRIPRAKAGPHRGARVRGHRYRSKGRWFPAAGRALVVPGTVGGREAHGPLSTKILDEKINRKELRKAVMSAIAATARKNLVEAHGHRIADLKSIPLVVDDSICDIRKTRELQRALVSLGLETELDRAANVTQRAGKGKMRGRRYKSKKSLLVIIPSSKKASHKIFQNISGIEAATPSQLNITLLAPGSTAGRLALWTKSSLQEVESRFKAKQ